MNEDPIPAKLVELFDRYSKHLSLQWLSKAVYFVCWMVALPLELVMNRRMGRRYAGAGPLAISLAVYLAIINYASLRSYGLPGGFGTRNAALGRSDFVLVIVGFIIVLAMIGNRFANWWRFRSNEQVHSYASGIPFWLFPPKFLLLGTRKSAADAARKPWDEGLPRGPMGIGTFFRVAWAFFRFGFSALSQFRREWRSGAVPTGPIAFLMATVLHPFITILMGALIAVVCKPLAVYFLWASVAIFIKGRIEKSEAVERIYDLFDARIDQEYTAALANPVKLRDVEAKGVIVPGLARSLAETVRTMESSETLPQELSQLVIKPGQQTIEVPISAIESAAVARSGIGRPS